MTFWITAAFAVVGHAQVFINEIDPNNVGVDTVEFVELFSAPGASLYGFAVVFFNGANDASYAAFDLDGYRTGPTGNFLLGNAAVVAAVSATPDILFPSNTLQNGADAVALYSANAADFPNGTAVNSTNLIHAIVYGGNDETLSAILGGFQSNVLTDSESTSINRTQDSWELAVPTPFGSGTPKGHDGDFNFDGFIDAADYVAWRKSPAVFVGDPAGYNTWRAKFGEPTGDGMSAHMISLVPEPTAVVPLMLAAAGCCLRRRRTA